MQCVYVLLAVMATTLAAPQTFSDWARIQKAQPVRHDDSHDTLKFQSHEKSWEDFKLTHGKSYEAEEEVHRFRVFLENMAYIDSHNREYNAGRSSFFVGMNYFGDFEFEEFRVLNGYRGNLSSKAKSSRFMKASYVELPDSVDWREHGYVTEVKNQGRCGSCWSFSATGALEGQHYKLKHSLASLSEQQLVDCSAMYGNHGCQGGLMDNAFSYIKDNGGIDSESSYPYVAVVEPQCHFHRSDIKARCTGFVDIEEGSETDLQHATATMGPISIAIDASHRSFQFYHGGVYDEPQCSPSKLDHGVLIVGYGTSDDGNDYWIVKNSWGPNWGQQGYINMSRNKQNQCGVASKASYPLV